MSASRSVGRRLAQRAAGEVQEQHQRIAVAGHRARAHRALRDQVLGEELLHQRGERRRLRCGGITHRRTSGCGMNDSKRSAASAINSGTADEVPVGVGHHRVPDVGRQRQHRLIDVHALRLPQHDAAHDEGVAQVMDARRVVSAAVDASPVARAARRRRDAPGDRSAACPRRRPARADEEWRIVVRELARQVAHPAIAPQGLDGARVHRHLARLAELGLLDGQHPAP